MLKLSFEYFVCGSFQRQWSRTIAIKETRLIIICNFRGLSIYEKIVYRGKGVFVFCFWYFTIYQWNHRIKILRDNKCRMSLFTDITSYARLSRWTWETNEVRWHNHINAGIGTNTRSLLAEVYTYNIYIIQRKDHFTVMEVHHRPNKQLKSVGCNINV